MGCHGRRFDHEHSQKRSFWICGSKTPHMLVNLQFTAFRAEFHMKKILEHLKKKFPSAQIKTAVIVKKPLSEFEPDYFAEESEGWIVFPYEKE